MAATAARQKAYRRGRLSETLACVYLRLKGYRVIERGYRQAVGEIDIIARRGDILAIVEVKRRADLAACLEALSPRQRRRISRAAAAFLSRHRDAARLKIRFDVIAMVPRRWPRHIMAAWQSDSP